MNDFQQRLKEAGTRIASLEDKAIRKDVVMGIPIARKPYIEQAVKTYGIWIVSTDRSIDQQKFFNIPDKESAERAKKCLKDKRRDGEDGFIEFIGWEVREECPYMFKEKSKENLC